MPPAWLSPLALSAVSAHSCGGRIARAIGRAGYAWALIPGFVGVGTVLMGLWEGKWSGIRGGLWLILISAIMFAVFGSFLGNLFGGGLGDITKWWPLALILLGVLSLIDYFTKPRRGADEPHTGDRRA